MINKNPAPAKAIADLWLSTKLNKEVKTLQIKSKTKSLLETPATNAYPERFPLVRLCLIIAKITGPMEMLKIRPNNNPFKIGSTNIGLDFLQIASSLQAYHLSILLETYAVLQFSPCFP